MKEIKFYLELHYGKRRPNFDVYLNGNALEKIKEQVIEKSQHGEKVIVYYAGELLENNCLQMVQKDKTDSDMVEHEGKWIDHYIQIKELEIDDQYLETAMLFTSSFRHDMPQEWLDRMKSQGIDILPVYEQCTDIRLNGTWTCNFHLPIWHFVITNKKNKK